MALVLYTNINLFRPVSCSMSHLAGCIFVFPGVTVLESLFQSQQNWTATKVAWYQSCRKGNSTHTTQIWSRLSVSTIGMLAEFYCSTLCLQATSWVSTWSLAYLKFQISPNTWGFPKLLVPNNHGVFQYHLPWIFFPTNTGSISPVKTARGSPKPPVRLWVSGTCPGFSTGIVAKKQ